MTNVSTTPDITSILVSWTPPLVEDGGKLITAYEITHQLHVRDANPIGQVQVNASSRSFRVTDLLPEVTYQIVLRAIIENLVGEPRTVTLSTTSIGECLLVLLLSVEIGSAQEFRVVETETLRVW